MSSIFDSYKEGYQDAVQNSISFIGQDLDFFTEVKATHLLKIIQTWFGESQQLRGLDVGCGVGLTDKFIGSSFKELHGVDVSAGVLDTAKKTNPSVKYQIYDGMTLPYQDQSFDFAFAINVFHHIPPAQWATALKEIYRVVKTGGLGIVFEHNPINPLTQLAVKRCPFDADAVLISSKKMRSLFSEARFKIVKDKYILFFPWRLQIFRGLEDGLAWLPLGAQYFVCGAKKNI